MWLPLLNRNNECEMELYENVKAIKNKKSLFAVTSQESDRQNGNLFLETQNIIPKEVRII